MSTVIARQEPWDKQLQTAATANGNGNPANVGGMNGSVTVEITNTGTGTATIQLQGSFDDVTWYNLGYQRVDNIAAPARSVSAIAVTASTFAGVFQVLDYYPMVRAALSGVTGSVVINAHVAAVAV